MPLQLQLEKLTAAFQCVTEDLRRQFMVDGEPLLHEDSIGSSPVLASSFRRQIGFSAPERPPLTFSPGTCCASLSSAPAYDFPASSHQSPFSRAKALHGEQIPPWCWRNYTTSIHCARQS